jgi:hypothetical protein
MIFPFVLTAVGLFGLFLILYLAVGLRPKGGNLDELVAQLRPIDVDAFRNLIDEREEEYLRSHLPMREFRGVHRERMMAAVEYVWCAARNTSILMSLGERLSPPPIGCWKTHCACGCTPFSPCRDCI